MESPVYWQGYLASVPVPQKATLRRELCFPSIVNLVVSKAEVRISFALLFCASSAFFLSEAE